MATEAVCKYLRDTNRPYSANDIVLNLHKEFGKTVVTRALDTLVADKRVTEKTYGKQKVYAIAQDDATDQAEMESELKTLDFKCNEICEKLKQSEVQIKDLDAKLKAMLSTPTNTDAASEKQSLSDNIAKLEEKLKQLSENSIQISPELREKTEKDYRDSVTIYRKRKRICMEIIDSIMEGYPKSKKMLIEEIGVETDESVDCVIKG